MKKIVQIYIVQFPVDPAWEAARVFGLGDDNRVYWWDPKEEIWVLYSTKE